MRLVLRPFEWAILSCTDARQELKPGRKKGPRTSDCSSTEKTWLKQDIWFACMPPPQTHCLCWPRESSSRVLDRLNRLRTGKKSWRFRHIQGDTSARLKPPVDLDLGCSAILPGQKAATVAAHELPELSEPSQWEVLLSRWVNMYYLMLD